jgi:hypothetical protein
MAGYPILGCWPLASRSLPIRMGGTASSSGKKVRFTQVLGRARLRSGRQAIENVSALYTGPAGGQILGGAALLPPGTAMIAMLTRFGVTHGTDVTICTLLGH